MTEATDTETSAPREAVLMYGLTSKTLFSRAGEIAAARYPNGCGDADKLADIAREVISAARLAALRPSDAPLNPR